MDCSRRTEVLKPYLVQPSNVIFALVNSIRRFLVRMTPVTISVFGGAGK